MAYGLITLNASGQTLLGDDAYFERAIGSGVVAPTNQGRGYTFTYLVPGFDPSLHDIAVACDLLCGYLSFSPNYGYVGVSVALGSFTIGTVNNYNWQYAYYRYYRKLS